LRGLSGAAELASINGSYFSGIAATAQARQSNETE
jgi:hypothetical protein